MVEFVRRAAILLCLATAPRVLAAQGEIVGRVVADSARDPVPNVQVTMARLSRTATSDSVGRFRLSNLPAGDHVLVLRAFGFRVDSVTVEIDGNEVIMRDFVLKREAQALPRARIAASAPSAGKLAAFYERQKAGIGHFITRDELAKAEGGMRLTGDVLAKVPGLAVKRGGSKAWIATGRAPNALGGCAFCVGGKLPPVTQISKADFAAGARPACYMDVYVDGVLAFDSTQPESGLFDVNSIPPSQIEAIEVYTSAAQIPAQYNKTSNGCGVMLIWTRI